MSSQVCQDLVLAQNPFWSWPFSQRILSLFSSILVSWEFSWSCLACQGQRWAGRPACWGQGWVGRRQNCWCQTLPGELSATGQTGEFYPKQWSEYPVCSHDKLCSPLTLSTCMWTGKLFSAIHAMYFRDLTWILGTPSGGSSYRTTVRAPVFTLRPMYCLYGPWSIIFLF